jgi:cell division transport system permease protein
MKWSPLKVSLIAVISLLQIFLIVFYLSYKNLNSLLGSWSDSSALTIYLKTDASEKDVAQLMDFLKDQKTIREAKLINRKQAITEFQKSIGATTAGLLTEDELIDLIPETIELYSTLDISGEEKISFFEKLSQKIKANQFVDEVLIGANWLKRFTSVDQFFQMFGFSCFLILLLTMGLLTSLMIRVLIEDSKSEIEVFNLLGATRWSIYKIYLKDILFSSLLCLVMSISLSYFIFIGFRSAFIASEFGKHFASTFYFVEPKEFLLFSLAVLFFILLSSLSSITASLKNLSQSTYD